MSKIIIKVPPNIINNYLENIVYQASQNAIRDSLALVNSKWQSEAQKKLKSTLPNYLLGLGTNSIVYPYNSDFLSGAFVLRGRLPNMIETGYSAFDMKTGFSKSKRKKASKNGGWYLTIPFRHGTPKSFMWGNPMSKELYSSAKKLKNNKSLKISGGQKTSWTGYRHKNNINDGLKRIINQNINGKNQSHYITMRRVSNKSDPSSWKHPGYNGTKISDLLPLYAEKTFKKCIEMSLS